MGAYATRKWQYHFPQADGPAKSAVSSTSKPQESQKPSNHSTVMLLSSQRAKNKRTEEHQGKDDFQKTGRGIPTLV